MTEPAPSSRELILQISPNDHPPFQDICAVYRAAGERLGFVVETIYLSPAVGERVREAHYLDAPDLSAVRDVAHRLAQTADSFSQQPVLALCHRYRAYRALRSSRISASQVVTVAHEFGFFKRLQRRIERRLFAADTIFAGVSPAVVAEMATVVEGALCLPNGIDVDLLERARLSRTAALAELALDDHAFTIGLVGRLVPKKQPGLAIEAVRLLLDRGADVRLLVIGDGELKDELQSMAAGLPVEFCGFVPDARRLLQALDVLLLVSKQVEAFGMGALEAMTSGVPVVTGPAPGPRYVLGSAGYYYDKTEPETIAQALWEIYQNDQARQAKVQQGVERARREFSIDATADRLQQLLPMLSAQ